MVCEWGMSDELGPLTYGKKEEQIERDVMILHSVTEDGEAIALVKPQFQVGQDKVGKGGVVRDPEQRRQAISDTIAAAESIGFSESTSP